MKSPINNSAFKYVGLAHKLMRHIAVASLQPGDRLPTEDELIREHGLSRITVRRALSILEKDGLVSRKRKRGTIVSRAISESLELDNIRGRVVIAIPVADATTEQADHATTNLLRGLERFLADRGFTLQIMSVGSDGVQDRTRLLRLIERDDLEGICAVGPCLEHYQDLLEQIPHVNSCTFLPTTPPWVGIDTEDIAYTSVKHVIERGHQRVAMICGSQINNHEFAAFIKGYRRALAEHDLPFCRALVHHAYEGESPVELAEQVLSDIHCPTAVFAEDWRIAKAVLTACQNLGLKIPSDLSLVSCGQNTQYVASSIGITAYLPDNEKVGQEIGRVLLQIIDENKHPKDPIFVPGRFVEHDSVADPSPKRLQRS
jgi:GntR family transcriptional regulator, arabinose operon transcriptional repressor